uniref:(northern house mosquito) hypothetical protein n=1 Tax=Culex pipiens TaxID=7175 RepID=A0A8D7ZUK8_CULPI
MVVMIAHKHTNLARCQFNFSRKFISIKPFIYTFILFSKANFRPPHTQTARSGLFRCCTWPPHTRFTTLKQQQQLFNFPRSAGHGSTSCPPAKKVCGQLFNHYLWFYFVF